MKLPGTVQEQLCKKVFSSISDGATKKGLGSDSLLASFFSNNHSTVAGQTFGDVDIRKEGI